ncbi:hypothetical protein ACIBAC_15115 [Streptomyces sp. NPDC051362]|uniref:hypothetical protein n=1 Tax=Streptomyces sp. NPDC051362 TaxID=3365651 RepID=UPI0037907ABC
MATTHPTDPERAARHAEVRRLADEEHLSHRAIARRLGMHHTTVGRILRTTTAPEAPPVRTTTAPTVRTTPVTSGAVPRPPELVRELDPWLIQDLNVLMTGSGALPAPVARAIHAAAEHRRAQWRTASERREQAAP